MGAALLVVAGTTAPRELSPEVLTTPPKPCTLPGTGSITLLQEKKEMANAWNNLRGFVRDLRACLAASDVGDQAAGQLLDTLCDDLDVLMSFGSEPDGAGDEGHDGGGDDPEGDGETVVEVPRGTELRPPAADAGASRQFSGRRGTRPAVLRGATTPTTERVMLRGPRTK